MIEVSHVEKNLEIGTLLDFYADLLTENQRQALNLYYNEDFSLSEIAEQQGITRQAVRDTIQKAQTQLFELENKLRLSQKFNSMRKKMKLITETIEKLLLEKDVNKIKSLVSEMKKIANTINNEL